MSKAALTAHPASEASSEEEEEEQETEEEEGRSGLGNFFHNHKLALKAGFVFFYLALGIWVGMRTENWRFLTAVYLIVQIVTTVGYGDIAIDTPEMRWFMTFYVFFGIAIIANIVNELVAFALEQEEEALRATLRGTQDKYLGKKQGKKIGNVNLNRLIAAIAIWTSTLAFWVIFFSTYEWCSCSYGGTEIEGCVEGETCPATQGRILTWDEAVYMAVITMTTVGFGDFTPESELGRGVASIAMLFGAISTVNLVSNMSISFAAITQKRNEARTSSRSVFREIDTDGSMSLSQNEFRIYMLLKNNLVDNQTLLEFDKTFLAMDKDKSGTLTYDELAAEFDRM